MEPLTLIEMIILDTSVWIALLDQNDSCRNRAIKIVANINSGFLKVFDHIYSEVLTVLRNKALEQECPKFVNFLQTTKIKVNLINENMLTLANFFFFQYKKLSFTDCLLLAAAKTTNAELITFDKELKKIWEKMQK